jgi:hypothetical protein
MAKKKNNIPYITQYQKENTTQYRFVCHKVYDADIIAKMESVPKKATYIKQLIRQDLAKNKEVTE